MRGDREHRTIFLAGTTADDIPRGIHHDVLQTIGLHELHDRFAANLFRKGRGFDFGNADLFGHGALDFLSADVESRLDGRHRRELFDLLDHLGFKLRHTIFGCHGGMLLKKKLAAPARGA